MYRSDDESRPGRRWPRGAVLAATVGLIVAAGAQCSFSPDLSGGLLKCGPAGSCPDDYECKQTYCCARTGETHLECTGSAPPADGGAPPDLAGDAPPGGDGAASGGTIGTPRRLVPGNFDLASVDATCTRANPPTTADRWCAIGRGSELWILNVTQAAKDPIACNGSNPGCLRLTSTLFTTNNDALSYTHAGFSGDLLIYYADANIDPAAPNVYRGPIYAWYPGWTAPRVLTSPGGGRCFSHDRISSPAAWCSDRAADGLTVDVRAGVIAADHPLPLLLNLGPNHILAGFNRTGDRLLFALGPPADAAWPLYMVPTTDTADPAKRVTIAPKAKSWTLSGDGTLIYVIKEEGLPKGPVFTVDTATGTLQTQLPFSAEQVSAVSDGADNDLGLATQEDAAGDVYTTNLYLDRANPAKAIAVGKVAGLLLSSDRRTSFTWKLLDKGRHDASLFDNQTGASCALQTEARALNLLPTFSPDGHFVFWLESGPTYSDGTGWVAVAPGCTTKRMFTGGPLYFYHPLNGNGLLYQDASDGTLALRYLKFNRDTAEPSGALKLDTRVLRTAVIDPDRKQAVYSTGDPGREGIYVVDL